MGTVQTESIHQTTFLDHNGDLSDNDENGSLVAALPNHPLGVKPSGNALTATENAADRTGKFRLLPEDVLVVVLEWLDARSLQKLGYTCRSMFAYASHEPFWRGIFIL